MLIVRLLPAPPNTMFSFGTKARFEDRAVTIRLPGAVCASFTINGIRPVGVSWSVVRFPMAEMVGGLLPLGLRNTVKVRVTILLDAPRSLTLTATATAPVLEETVRKRMLPVGSGFL